MIEKYKSFKSRRMRFDLIRGRWTNTGFYMGALEKQHGSLWEVPLRAVITNYLLKDLPMFGLKANHESVLRAFIGNTWNFNKACEFVTWDHLLNGKQNPDTGEYIAGPANISRGSLKAAIDNLIAKGLVYKIIIEDCDSSYPLYAPSVWASGKPLMTPDIDTSFRAGKNSCPHIKVILSDLFTPIIPLLPCKPYEYDEHDRYLIHNELLGKLKHPVLLTVFAEQWKTHLTPRAVRITELRKQLTEKLSENPVLDGGTLDRDYYEYYRDLPKDSINSDDHDWLSKIEVQESITQLTQGLDRLHRKLPSENKEDALIQAKLLLALWGEELITLSADVWHQWSELVTASQCEQQNAIRSNLIEKRKSLPWLKKQSCH